MQILEEAFSLVAVLICIATIFIKGNKENQQ